MAEFKLVNGKWIKNPSSKDGCKDIVKIGFKTRCKDGCKYLIKMGFKPLKTGRVQRYQCKDCGHVSY